MGIEPHNRRQSDQQPIINEVDERDSVSYEEFGGNNDYVNCPTCQGTGRVASSQTQQLVALIPYDDERLKPKKTALWVVIGMSFAICMCAILCGLLVYFLIPRIITVQVMPIIRNNITFADDSSTHINFTIPIKLSNPNFLFANFSSAVGQISFMKSQVGTIKEEAFQILAKRSEEIWHNITVPVVFSKQNHLDWISGWCNPTSMGTKTISVHIQLSTNVTFRGAPQQTAISHLCYVSCDPDTISNANCMNA